MYYSKIFLKIPAPALRVLPSLTTSSPAVPASARAGQWGHYGTILLRTTQQHLNKLFPKNTTFIGDDMRLIVVMVWWPPLSPVFPAQGPAHINNVWLSVASQLLRCIPVLATQFNLAPPGAALDTRTRTLPRRAESRDNQAKLWIIYYKLYRTLSILLCCAFGSVPD